MELRELRCFVAVAEELHFGRAAARLHVAQPAVSQQVRRLERELGVPLFDRTSRRVRPTPEGVRFLAEARAVLAAVERARASVAPVRRLRLGTSAGLGRHLDRVLDRLPGVRVDLDGGPRRLDRVAAGALDAAFVRGVADHPGLDLHPVWEEPLLAALPAGHRLAEAGAVRLADLAALPLRLADRRRNRPLADLMETASPGQRVVAEPASLDDALALIGAGEPLWTVVYAAHAERLHRPRVAVLPMEPPLALTTYLAVRPDCSWTSEILLACGDKEP
ncbi:LysR family transcriptional regulator [Actinocorallia herbida]|uniref:LysR family transcriptional regulator n=1 Tax=Actinocorallia herbida TaxID=58109 RepID=UPI000F4BA408|nr:LysR family transcriptional regulator [Actinocorallia herbida]